MVFTNTVSQDDPMTTPALSAVEMTILNACMAAGFVVFLSPPPADLVLDDYGEADREYRLTIETAAAPEALSGSTAANASCVSITAFTHEKLVLILNQIQEHVAPFDDYDNEDGTYMWNS